jgi:hypothetical protein
VKICIKQLAENAVIRPELVPPVAAALIRQEH